MKNLKRFVASTMLGLSLTLSAATLKAQEMACSYAGTLVLLYSDGTWEAYDVYVCG